MPLMPPRPLTRRRLLALGAAVAGGALLPVTPRRAGAEGAEGAVIRATLDNGLVVLIEERPVADTVALRLTARVGVRDDGERPGIAALAQRSLLQGTTRRPTATDLLRVAAEVGSTLNRSLTAEASAVACVMQSGRLAIALDLLADIVGAPRFDPDAVRRQQGLLAGELAARKVNPPALMTDLFDRTLFAGHPLAAGSLITEDDVWALTNDDLAAHHTRAYAAANLVLAIVGRVRADDALTAARRYFGALPAGDMLARTHLPLPPADGPRTARGTAGRAQTIFRLGFAAPSSTDSDRYPLHLLTAMLSGPSGRLFREIRTARGLAYTAGAGYLLFSDAGAWIATAGVEPRNLDEAVAVTHAVIAQARAQPPTATDVAAKTTQIAGEQVVGNEDNDDRAATLAAVEVSGAPTVEEFVRRIRQVTPDEVHRVARQYLDPERAVLVVVGPPESAGGRIGA